MDALAGIVAQYGYLAVAVWLFLDQLGVPIPGIPVLILAGAVAGEGQLDLGGIVLAATLGSVPSDLIWYAAGRLRGAAILRFVCRVSLEPDSCVRKTEDAFARHGARSLLFAKFVPGYQTVAPPLAAIAGVSPGRFLLYDVPGAVLYCGVFAVAGFALHDQIELVVDYAARAGAFLGAGVVVWLLGYAGWKFYHRQRLIRSLRVARIEPVELKRLLDAGEPVTIVDLRNALEIGIHGERLPGAQVVAVESLSERHHELPRDREIVLYCT